MSSDRPAPLFSMWPVDTFLNDRWEYIKERIAGFSEQMLSATTGEKLADEIFDEYSVIPIKLGNACMKPVAERTVPTVDFDGTRGRPRRVFLFTLAVPFTGNSDLLHAFPAQQTLPHPTFNISDEELLFPFLNRNELPQDSVDAQLRQELAHLNRWLVPINDAVERHNQALKGDIPKWIQMRKARLDASNNLMAGLSFPIKKSLATPTLAVPIQRRQLRMNAEQSPGPITPEHLLEEAHYKDILHTLALMSTVMEKSPHAFAKVDEEALRFFFLVWLNANYEGGATGETFNFGGKTDILISVKGKTIFIGECKFWKGPASLIEAIDQILGYASWRDNKTAILLFNRDRVFTTVLNQIVPTVATHSNYVATIDDSEETVKRFQLRSREDPERLLTLTVLAFNVPLPDIGG